MMLEFKTLVTRSKTDLENFYNIDLGYVPMFHMKKLMHGALRN